MTPTTTNPLVSSSSVDMLKGVRSFVERGWTRKAYARRDDTEVHPRSGLATCWCLAGAAQAAVPSIEPDFSENWLAENLGFVTADQMVSWNDYPRRTKAEVLSRIDQAITRLSGGS